LLGAQLSGKSTLQGHLMVIKSPSYAAELPQAQKIARDVGRTYAPRWREECRAVNCFFPLQESPITLCGRPQRQRVGLPEKVSTALSSYQACLLLLHRLPRLYAAVA
jgi:hypothetical protein